MRGTVTKAAECGSGFLGLLSLGMPAAVTSSFAATWLAGEPRALAFLPDRFRREEDRRRAVADASARAVDPSLLDVIARRNALLPASLARQRNLERLARPGTVVVVTGQQAGLFLGPLYTVYKTASAIVAARALEAETGRPCVPVFWLQCEDHDLAEIDHCVVPTGADPLRLDLGRTDSAASRVPISEVTLGEGVLSALDALGRELGRHAHAEEHLGLLARAYRPDATLPQAFVQVLAELFAEEGLIVVDPRDPAMAAYAAPLHHRALQDAAGIAEALRQRSDALVEAGFKVQVHVRAGAPLSFVAPDGERAQRYRIAPAREGQWSFVGSDVADVGTATLERWLRDEPLRFTTSALLRPLLQDTWLPNAAYVGGPGEIAYFAQLGPLYARFDLPMPLVVPRARFRVLDERARGQMAKLGLTANDLGRARKDILLGLAAAARGDDSVESPESVEARLLATIAPSLSAFGEIAAGLDPSLAKASKRTEQVVREAIGKLVARYGKTLVRRDGVASDRLDRLLAFVLPGGAPQERVYSLPYFACRFGQRDFLRRVMGATEPFAGELRDLPL